MIRKLGIQKDFFYLDHVTSWGAERALFGIMLIYTIDTGTTGANEFSNVIELFAFKIVKSAFLFSCLKNPYYPSNIYLTETSCRERGGP